MKLSTARVRQTLDQLEEQAAFTDTAAVPEVVKLASWSDAARTSLAVRRPEPTEIVAVLEPEEEA